MTKNTSQLIYKNSFIDPNAYLTDNTTSASILNTVTCTLCHCWPQQLVFHFGSAGKEEWLSHSVTAFEWRSTRSGYLYGFRPINSPIQLVLVTFYPGLERPVREAHHSLSGSSELTAKWSHTSAPTIAFKVMHTENFSPKLQASKCSLVEASWNVMSHTQKPDFVFRAKRTSPFKSARGRQFSRLLAAEVCASAVVMLDTPCSEVVWRVLATHSIRQSI